MNEPTVRPPRHPRRARSRHLWLRRVRSLQGSEKFLLLSIMVWLGGTVAGFIWGPLKYDISNRRQLYIYLFAVHAALVIGFLRGSRSRVRQYSFAQSPRSLLRLSLAVSAVYFVITLPLDPQTIMGDLRAAMQDPWLARAIFINSQGGWRDYLGIFVAPLTLAFIPLGIFYWRTISWSERLLIMFFASAMVFRSVATASRHGLWYLMITAAGAFLAAHFSGMLRIRAWALAGLSTAVLTGFTIYSNFIAIQRIPEGASMEYGWQLTADWIDQTNVVYRIAPEAVRPAFLQGFAYFTHGYRGLAIALNLPFRGLTYGVGNSLFLTRSAQRILDSEELYHRSISYRMASEANYGDAFWMTVYPWLASDVTFPGSLLVVMLIGAVLVASYREAVLARNPFAVLSFCWFLFMVMSFPQGSITQDGSIVFTLIVTVGLWRLSRKHVRSRGRRLKARPQPGVVAVAHP